MSNYVFVSDNSSASLAISLPNQFGRLMCSSHEIDQFSNTETRVLMDIKSQPLLNKDVVITRIGSCNSNCSINDSLMKVKLIADAAKRENARSIILISPYYPYSRQDKRDHSGAPISCAVVARELEAVGIDRLITIDLHSSQTQAVPTIPTDNIYCGDYLIEYLRQNIIKNTKDNFVLVSPDMGALKRVQHYADELGLISVCVHKERDHIQKSKIKNATLLGKEQLVKNKTCIIIDDMIDTAGTICAVANILDEHKAHNVIIVATHGILSGPALNRLNKVDIITKVIVTNTLCQITNKKNCNKLEVVDISHLISEKLKLLCNNDSDKITFLMKELEIAKEMITTQQQIIEKLSDRISIIEQIRFNINNDNKPSYII